MLQRARGTIALLSGFLLAGSYLVQASSGLNSDPTALAQEPVSVSTPLAQEPVSVSTPSPASIPSASSVPGATEAARVQPPRPRDEAEAKILSVLDALDHYREGTSNVPREDGRMLHLLAEARATETWSSSARPTGTGGSGSAWH